MSIEIPPKMPFKILVSDSDPCEEFEPEIEPNTNFLSPLTLANKNDLLKNYSSEGLIKVSKSILTFINQESKSANNIHQECREEECNEVTFNQKSLATINHEKNKKKRASCACIIF